MRDSPAMRTFGSDVRQRRILSGTIIGVAMEKEPVCDSTRVYFIVTLIPKTQLRWLQLRSGNLHDDTLE